MRFALALTPAFVACVTCIGVFLACSSDKGNSGFGTSGAPTATGPSTGFPTSVTPDAPPPPACVSSEAPAIEGARPVDIIFVIDNSESMAEEIGEVESQINDNFVSIIATSNADYRVFMLSRHGTHGADGGLNQRICVKAPLSGTSCNPVPSKPVETERFIHHSIDIDSNDALCQVISSFHAPDANGDHPQGWAPFLRAEAFKTFAVITDDRVKTSCNGLSYDDKGLDPLAAAASAGTFDSALFGLSPQFGTVARRNYVWHSIIGVAPFDTNDLTKPYPPTAPLETNLCTPSSEASGLGYQALSKLTNGLRYPTCGLDYTTIFRAMAKDVLDKSIVSCDYALPTPEAGAIDPATAIVRYASGATTTDFGQVTGAPDCAPGKFFIDGKRVKLCPDSCLRVQNDPSAKVTILFSCFPKGTQ